MTIPLHAGDRILVRDRPWVVREVSAPYATQAILQLHALDETFPPQLTVISPPEEVSVLPGQAVEFDLRGIDSFSAWSRAHRMLGASLIRESGILTGVRFGRVALEAYQLAPTLRILAKVRPTLLIADDVGLGKTIEAGLALLELMARGRASRVLVVTPPGLMDQWDDELLDKFGLEFTIIGNAAELAAVQTCLPAGVSPWDALPRVITSVDFLKKETVRNRALRKRWDLVIVDEAHALAEAGTPENPYRVSV
ncbi:MAG: SNF2-related protein [Candidatus Aminicenantales bacterium]